MVTMADNERRPAIVIRTIEGRRSSERTVLSNARYQEQVTKLETRGVAVPHSARNPQRRTP